MAMRLKLRRCRDGVSKTLASIKRDYDRNVDAVGKANQLDQLRKQFHRNIYGGILGSIDVAIGCIGWLTGTSPILTTAWAALRSKRPDKAVQTFLNVADKYSLAFATGASDSSITTREGGGGR
jgi:hypothetical protein